MNMGGDGGRKEKRVSDVIICYIKQESHNTIFSIPSLSYISTQDYVNLFCLSIKEDKKMGLWHCQKRTHVKVQIHRKCGVLAL